MSQNNLEDTGNVANLLSKLCNHYARNDQAVASHLLKYTYRFLKLSSNDEVISELYIVTKIRRFLSSKSEDSPKKFDVLYMKLQSINIIKQKASILQLLYEIAQTPSTSDFRRWPQSLDNSGLKLNKSKSTYSFLPDDVKCGSIKRIFTMKSTKLGSAHSSRTHLTNSGATSLGWSNSDHDIQLCKASSSSHSSAKSIYNSISETMLMHEIIYCFQGIEGKILRKEPGGLGFSIDLKVSKCMSQIHRGLVERLVNVGFIHNQIKQHSEDPDKHIGLMGQSLVAILKDELSTYYHFVSMMQTLLDKSATNRDDKLTLRRMIVWVAEPQLRLQWLASIAEECNEKKGGALLSAIYRFLQHGSICAQQVSSKVLSAACKPLYVMLSKWLLNGELQDPHGEFFIETRNIGKNSAERLWHDKYHIKKSMIPSFITMDQSRKILATGKGINFLRQICQDNKEMNSRDDLQKLFSTTSANALFTPEQSIELHECLENVYKETSLRVLDLLKAKYMMMDHLQALRRYLLLGQGDTIRHLLELLAPELNKPGDEVFSYTLNNILETAIQVTNARFENETIIDCLRIEIVQPSKQDIGWDVFALIYVIDGPVGTIFQPTMQIYKSLFGVLWNAKRMEFVLSNLRKQQITNAKLLRRIKELNPITRMLHLCTGEMIHFLHQTQYYFLFEILECSWAEMLRRVNHAECLDDVINAHNDFLKSVQSGMLLDQSSYELGLTLRSIFNTILQLETTQDCLFSAAMKEHEARLKYEDKCKDSSDDEVNVQEQLDNNVRMKKFGDYLNTMKKQIKTIAIVYNSHVKKYLNSLITSTDFNLQLLSVRLNFNDYYEII